MKRRKPLNELSYRQLRRLANHDAFCRDQNLQPSNESENSDGDEFSLPETARSSTASANSPSSIYTECLDYSDSFSPDFSSDSDEPSNLFHPSANLQFDPRNDSNPASEPSLSLEEDLSGWAVTNGITLSSLSALLTLLKKHVNVNLPSDARTLLKTPRHTIVQEIPPGLYWHAGLEKGIVTNLSNKDLNSIEQIDLAINIDGLPISRSSNSALWPILGSILPFKDVFLIGSYHGVSKPSDNNRFLQEFVSEMQLLTQSGLKVKGKQFSVKIKYLVMDAPAKSFILGVKGHMGYSSCTKCTVEGENTERRMSFIDIKASRRTDEDFRDRTDEEYHTGSTILERIPNVGLVTNVPLDYMHLICLGVVKKLLNLWLGGDLQYRLQSRKVNLISSRLTAIQAWTPKDFVRQPRSLAFVKLWKATEFRQFLLYLGPAVLNGIIDKKVYNNFLTLSVAIRILCTNNLDAKLLVYAKELLEMFVSSFTDLYGEHHVSHNVHGVIHLPDDVKNFGSLDNFSAFKFENFLQTLKNLLRKSDKPLQQLARRYSELENHLLSTNPCSSHPDPEVTLSSQHYNGPLTDQSTNPQHTKAQFPYFSLDTSSNRDNCCLLQDGSVITVKNFAHLNGTKQLVVLGFNFQEQKDLFSKPCPSSKLNIFKCSKLSETLQHWPISYISSKCYIYPNTEYNEFSVFPILHTSEK